MKSFFSKETPKAAPKEQKSNEKLQTLLQAVVYADYKTAEEIISKEPELLFMRGTVTDYSGRVHEDRTAFQ